jgi:hypothetical protein
MNFRKLLYRKYGHNVITYLEVLEKKIKESNLCPTVIKPENSPAMNWLVAMLDAASLSCSAVDIYVQPYEMPATLEQSVVTVPAHVFYSPDVCDP